MELPADKMPTLAYRGAPARVRTANPGGIVLLVWSPFLFVACAGFGLGAATLVTTFCQQFFDGRIDWSQFAVSLGMPLFALFAGLIALAFFRGGMAAIRIGVQLLRGQMPPLEGAIQCCNVSEALAYVLSVPLVLAGVFVNSYMLPFGGIFLGIGVALSCTRMVLRRAQRGYRDFFSAGTGKL